MGHIQTSKLRGTVILRNDKKQIRVGFLWQTLTSENLGVGALAQSQLAIARQAAAKAGVVLECIEFCPTSTKLSLAEQLDCEIADPLSIKKILLGQSAYLKQLKECDLVLDIGAGDSFSDIYGVKHFFFLCLTKIFALCLGKPLIMSPQTIGPFKHSWARFVAKSIMRRARRVFARDGLSMDVLKELKLTNNTQEVIDVAFRLPFEKKQHSAREKIKVGINVSGLLYNGGYTGNNQFGLSLDYVALIEKVIGGFTSMPDVEVHLVPHVLADSLPVEDDYRVIQALAGQFQGVIVGPKFSLPSEAKTYISGMDFFTGARMHACIGAFSSGVPVVPMAYSRKFNGLFNSLGYFDIADLKVHTLEEAYGAVIHGFERRDLLKQMIDKGNDVAQEKIQVYEDYLVGLFNRN